MSTVIAAGGAAVLGAGARWLGQSYAASLFDDAPAVRVRPLVIDASVLVVAIGALVGVFALYGPSEAPAAWPFAAFTAIALACGFVDARTGYLPDVLTLPLLVLGTAGPALLGGVFPQTTDSAVLGASLGFGVFVVSGAIVELGLGKTGLNGGDVKFAVALGAWTGLAGILPALLIGSLSMALYGLGRRVFGAGDGTVRFGPHLALGGLVALTAGWAG